MIWLYIKEIYERQREKIFRHKCLIWQHIIAALAFCSTPSMCDIGSRRMSSRWPPLTCCYCHFIIFSVTSFFFSFSHPRPSLCPCCSHSLSAGSGCPGLQASQQAPMTGSFNVAAISSPLMSSKGGAGPHPWSGESEPGRGRERGREGRREGGWEEIQWGRGTEHQKQQWW